MSMMLLNGPFVHKDFSQNFHQYEKDKRIMYKNIFLIITTKTINIKFDILYQTLCLYSRFIVKTDNNIAFVSTQKNLNYFIQFVSLFSFEAFVENSKFSYLNADPYKTTIGKLFS